ncbi:MAG: CCA tRNA nucleotidyltransferase [Candidatus Omnitrophica bacterium]|nr:CCA tRNA nucleotidyltransferase [Candidatus Omnitrophota bacterium]
MRKNQFHFPPSISNILELAIRIAVKQNLPIFVVGGFVRDFLLGVKNWDIDLVAESRDFKEGIAFAMALAKALNGEIETHRGFGTAVISYNFKGREMRMDVASTRKERYKKPAALPDVNPASITEDLERRDFSINAMAISLNESNPGLQLIDPFKGKEDLRRKRIRVLHNLSFIDDPTRILRAVRFAVRYNFCIERKTKRLIKEAIEKGMLKELKPQRLEKEIRLILKEKKPMQVFSKLFALGEGDD